jgi:ribulose kinase
VLYDSLRFVATVGGVSKRSYSKHKAAALSRSASEIASIAFARGNDYVGVPDRAMPAVVRPGTQIGAVCPEAAAVTGIPVGTPIIAGMTDG